MMGERGGASSAYSAMTDRGNADRGLRIAESGAALAEPVAATSIVLVLVVVLVLE